MKLQFALPGQVAALSERPDSVRGPAVNDDDLIRFLIPEALAAVTPSGIGSVRIDIKNTSTGIMTKSDVFNANAGSQVSRTYNLPISASYAVDIRAFSGRLGNGTQVYRGTGSIDLRTIASGQAVTAAVSMTPVINVPPVPTATAISSTGGSTATSRISPHDPNPGDTHSYAITTAPANGTASVSNSGVVSYTPAYGFSGSDSLTVTVTDQGGLTGSVAIPVTALFTRQVTGSVKNANNNAIAGATVSITGNGQTVATATANNAGLYSATLPAATYTITASKTGFTSASATFTLTVAGPTVVPTIVLVPSGTGVGDISGIVKDATTNTVISGATVSLRAGINAPLTDPVVATATSSAAGAYSFTGLAPGSYTATASKTGYADASVTATVSGGAATMANPILMSPLLSAGQVRIVLSWGATPSDLDSHLVGPIAGATTGSQQFHVRYNNQGSQSVSPFAQLDTDVTSGFGPETITIAQRKTGTYRYYVHDYTNRGNAANTALTGVSNAIVQVFVGAAASPTATFNVPVSGSGDMWHVFDLDGTSGAITPVNTIAMAGTEPARVTVSPVLSHIALGNNASTVSATTESVDQGTIAFNGSWTSSVTGVVTVSGQASSPTGLQPVGQGAANVTAAEGVYGYSAISQVDVVRFIVNTTADTVDVNAGDGACADATSFCSLRAAIQETNALAGADTVYVPGNTYTLTLAGTGEQFAATGDLDVRDSLTLTGDGVASTIDGNALDRIFHFPVASTSKLSGLQLTNGKAISTGGDEFGGAILNTAATVDITDCTLSANTADNGVRGRGGAIYNTSIVNIANSTLTSNTAFHYGGAIDNEGTLSVIDSTVSSNTSNTGGGVGGGGAIMNGSGTLNITNSDFFGNSASAAAGGFLYTAVTATISNSLVRNNTAGNGGGIGSWGGPLSIVNSTFSGNSATTSGGGIYHRKGTSSLQNVTVTNNSAPTGAGITFRTDVQPSSMSMINSLVVSQGGGGVDCSGIPSTKIANLDSDGTCAAASTSATPGIGALANNGGPTSTHALQAGSPAINAGNNANCPTTDQRGVARSDAQCDIGAFEF